MSPSPVIQRHRNAQVVPLPTIQLYNGLVGFWCSGFEYHLPVWDEAAFNVLQLTATGAPVLGAGSKYASQTTLFNGASYLSRADEAALRCPRTEPVTFSAWVYLTNLTGDHVVISKRDVGNIEYELKYDSSQQRWLWNFYNSAGSLFTLLSATRPVAGVWYLLIADYNPTLPAISLSVNAGAPQNNFSVSGFSFTVGQEFRIGQGPTGFLTGRIENVGRWNRILTVSERAAIFGSTLLDIIYSIITAASGGGSSIPNFPVRTAPVVPLDFTLDNAGANPVLSWVNNAANAVAVSIESRPGAGPYVERKQAHLDDTWTDTGRLTSADHSYRIRAINPFGASDYSAVLSTAPVAPVVSSYVENGLNCDAAWANQSEVTSWETQYNKNGAGWTTIGTVAVPSVSFPHGGITGDTIQFRVRAYRAPGFGAYYTTSLVLVIP